MAGHLRKSSREIKYWEKIASYINPISSLEEDEQCLKIISLSYHHLPVCLKPCFLFMGIFPKDVYIDASNLPSYWVAEGFIKPKKNQSLEEVAEDYLEEMIDRNLILVGERRWNGKAKRCFIHDVVRELCLKVGQKERFVCVLDDSDASMKRAMERERRIAIPRWNHNSDIVGALKLAPPLLRSLTMSEPWMKEELSVDFRLLRISANVNNISMKTDTRCFPLAVFQQGNLRYLSFCCWEPVNGIRWLTERPHLPSSISLFWNLQTLIVHNYVAPIAAPYEIWEMPQLRHLEFNQFSLPDPTYQSDQQERIVLRNLHTVVGVEGLRLTEEVCQRMPNIKKLSLMYYCYFLRDHCEASSYYCPHNLGRFNRLESLTLLFEDESKYWSDVSQLSFTFPTSLEELCVVCPHLYWEDLSLMVESSHHLRSLQLVEVKGSEWNLNEEEFPSLKTLIICRCDDLIYWNADSSHFPVLEYLHIFSVPELSEIPLDIGKIPTLRLIKLVACGMTAAISAMKIVVEQESLGNIDLQLHVNFLRREEVEIFQNMMQEEDLSSNNLRLYHGKTRPANY
ncbi:hypothetical protein C2S51_018569 [Perilla frutescens var. frutescens]|nr:hypothetical protein C2S51_018569 [Perilla frutescens var. frutescens]